MSYLEETLGSQSPSDLADIANALDAHADGHCMLSDFQHPSQTTAPVAMAAHLLMKTGLSASELASQVREAMENTQ